MSALILLSLCLCSSRGVWGQVVVNLPPVVEVREGDTVKIPCNFTILGSSSVPSLHWLYDKNGRQTVYTSGPEGISAGESELKGRVSVAEDFTLVISDTRLQDERIFICRVEAESGESGENRTQLRVYKAPEVPEIKMTDVGILVTNESTEIASCVSKNGFPAPHITWYKNRTPLSNGKEQVAVTSQVIQESSGLFTVSSTLSLPVQRSDSNAFFYCEVAYQLPGGDHMMESERWNITVLYPNMKLTLLKKSPLGPVKEGDTVELRCEGDGSPQPERTYSRTIAERDEEILGEGPSLVLEKVQREDSGRYMCQGLDLNYFDASLRAETEIHVHYLDTPQFSQMSPLIVTLGDDLSVLCEVNGSAETQIQWKSKGKVVVRGPSLNLSQVNHSVSATYKCVIDMPSVPGLRVSRELEVIVEGKPEVSVSSLLFLVQENDLVNVTCTALGHPKPHITWSANGTTVQRHDGHRLISGLSFLVTPELIRSGVTCTASNKHGISEEEVRLEERPVTRAPSVTNTVETIIKEPTKAGSHGVVIVVVIVCILLLAVLGAVLYFLYKKGHIPCGRSGKQDITKSCGEKDGIVVEMKPDSPAEESVLLPGPTDKKLLGDQGEKYMDLRN